MKIKKQIIVRVLAATVITCAVIYTTTNQHEANVAYEKEVHKYRFIEVNQIEKERITKMFSNNSFGFVRMKNESEVLNLHCDICAIVTSSGQLLGSGAGAEIDKNTCVIRMNTAPTRGYEKDVGTKTTLRMFSFVNLQQQLFEKEQFFEQEGITGTFVIWSTTVKEILSMVEEESLRLLKQYPSLDLYISSFEQMDFADRVFRQETGQDRAASGSWLSTGWYTLLLALTMCEHVKVYGMVESDYCHNHVLLGMAMCGYVWPGMAVCGYVWPGMTVCGYVWPGMAVCGYVWPGMTVCGYVWPGMAVCGYIWLGMAVCGYVWPGMTMCGCVWPGMAVCGYVWLGMTVCGYV
uniref:Alpha-N-acetylgalactosaminide alpha-2,6-sialyltransferase 3-like n=1 Tax=Saccoglossus kowalevskii TaxID=10224 RepID=A0ABM0MXY9_SACKO|nr:PREDICTED: alpha-N-acetylgalactosaminide alpha-2,6-sialyltransferase 3-like [Saccoglossus kowalevskii]